MTMTMRKAKMTTKIDAPLPFEIRQVAFEFDETRSFQAEAGGCHFAETVWRQRSRPICKSDFSCSETRSPRRNLSERLGEGGFTEAFCGALFQTGSDTACKDAGKFPVRAIE